MHINSNNTTDKRKRFKDYPLSFWFAVIATITAAFLAISSYSRMINDDTALIKASLIVIVLEGGLIVGMAAIKGHLQGTLKGWAFAMLWFIACAEIFMASMEIQHGIATAGANAENVTASTANTGAVATSLASATKALADCDKRYPRKNKDAGARNQCRKPYEAIVKSSAGAMPSSDNMPKYDAEDAGKLSQWQAVADTLNSIYEPEKAITWSQAAFYIMTVIMALFVLVKNFLWAKYAHDTALADALADGEIYTTEQNLGTVTEQPVSTVTEQPYSTVSKPFGFTPSQPAPSTAARNRALQDCNYSTVTTERNNYSTVTTEPNNSTVGTNSTVTTVGTVSALNAAKAARIGSVVNCPQCCKQFVKNSHNHLYCSNNRKPRVDGGNCSDDWHNAHNPSRTEFLFKRRR